MSGMSLSNYLNECLFIKNIHHLEMYNDSSFLSGDINCSYIKRGSRSIENIELLKPASKSKSLIVALPIGYACLLLFSKKNHSRA